MQDGVIKGTGNSWNLKSVPNFLTLYPTYEAFVQALVAGTLPIDLNGMNSAGWSRMGTALNKANLLKDATAALYGLPATAVPDNVLAAIPQKVNSGAGWTLLKAYLAAGTYNWTAPDLFSGKTYDVGVMVIGGGGAGGFCSGSGSGSTFPMATGGGSGFTLSFILTVTPGKVYKAVVGAGGTPVGYSANHPTGRPGGNGGTSSFNGVHALGGYGGLYGNNIICNGANGAQGSIGNGIISDRPSDNSSYETIPFGGKIVLNTGTNGYISGILGSPAQCYNPFECKRIMGAGGSTVNMRNSGGKDPLTGKGGGDGGKDGGQAADDNGCGGGAAGGAGVTSGTSGAGGAGAVKIYVRRMSA